MHDVAEAQLVLAVVLQRPQKRDQPGGRRLDQRWDEDVVGAEAHPEPPERRAPFLVERTHLLGDVAPVDETELLDQPERDAARDACQLLGVPEVDQRLEQALDLEIDEALGARRDLVAGRAGELFVGQQDDTRLQYVFARRQRADRRADPAQRAIGGKRNVAVAGSREALGARLELGGQRLLRGRLHRLGVLAAGARVGGEAEPLQFADMVTLDEDRSAGAYFGILHRVFSEPPHEDGSPAVYEAFRQPLMQRVRQPVLDFARLFAPV